MQTHPFINSVLCRMAGVALAVVSCSISALLLYYYGHTGWLVAWLDSLFRSVYSVSPVSCSGM